MADFHFSASPRLSRRNALQAALAGAVGGLLPGLADAQAAWPDKPITMVIGYPPGGQTDFAGRMLTGGLQAALGQSVVIDNRAGAGGNIGADYVLKSPVDGYKLLVGNGNITINPHTYRNLAMVDPLKLTPIALLLESALILAVPTTLPVKDLSEYIAWVQAQDKARGGCDYSSGGAGSLTHTTMELFRDRIGGPKMNHVPYKGSGPAMIDLIAGRVNGMFDAASVVAPFIRSGQLRPLMVTSATRIAAFPDLPTATEKGLKDFNVTAFIGLYGPPGLPADIVKKMNAAVNTAMKDPSVLKSISDRGEEPGGGTPEQLAQITRAYFKTWGEVVKANDIRAD